jgi:predicted HicB family RNase H-like nuclease
MLVYKGFIASIDYQTGSNSFMGQIINAPDVIEFQGENARELKANFERAVDEYLQFNKEESGRSVTPFIARFNLYLTPGQQQAIINKANQESVSVEYWLNREFNHYLQSNVMPKGHEQSI